jgi:hypothetical protein
MRGGRGGGLRERRHQRARITEINTRRRCLGGREEWGECSDVLGAAFIGQRGGHRV